MRSLYRKLTMLGAVVIAMATLSACFGLSVTGWTQSTSQMYITGGHYSVDMVYKRRATTDVVDLLWHRVNNRSATGTLEDMETFQQSAGFKSAVERWGFRLADISYFFDVDQRGDFEEAALRVYGRGDCIAMYRNPFALGDRHNWTVRSWGNDGCTWGKYFYVPGLGADREEFGWP